MLQNSIFWHYFQEYTAIFQQLFLREHALDEESLFKYQSTFHYTCLQYINTCIMMYHHCYYRKWVSRMWLIISHSKSCGDWWYLNKIYSSFTSVYSYLLQPQTHFIFQLSWLLESCHCNSSSFIIPMRHFLYLNYHPILVLPIFSKFLEHLAHFC